MKMQSGVLISRAVLVRFAASGLVLLAVSSLAQAQLLDQLKGAISSKSDGGEGSAGSGAAAGLMGAMGGKTGQSAGLLSSLPAAGSTANVAGVLQFCVKNNYLSGNAAASVKDRLMGKLGGEKAPASPGYVEGVKGILSGSNGQKVSLGGQGGLKEKLTHQVCEKILEQGKSLL